jgi:hypothetical protein
LRTPISVTAPIATATASPTQESAASYYVGGQVHYFSVNPATGNWSFWWVEPGHTVQPALLDGECAYQDYDCDGEPNWSDTDWTDGTC